MFELPEFCLKTRQTGDGLMRLIVHHTAVAISDRTRSGDTLVYAWPHFFMLIFYGGAAAASEVNANRVMGLSRRRH